MPHFFFTTLAKCLSNGNDRALCFSGKIEVAKDTYSLKSLLINSPIYIAPLASKETHTFSHPSTNWAGIF